MKKTFAILTLALSFTLISCNGNADNNSSKAASSSADTTTAQVADTTATIVNNDGEAPAAVTPTTATPTTATPAANVKQNGPVKPETEADKLLKQYSEAFINQIQASQAGKGINKAEEQHLNDLMEKLNQMEKDGKLSESQKQLLKATNDAYNQFKKK